uniref:Uncharacterized protein n=1 Tax=Chromera velia CCMP2878 TaxID=1169474 RepID=A0A0G4FJF2_9ALVE|eukprot:Cvel_3405.t1-p1 / transcript=Cvel_3405.t1 / gene=Cvel_3405 / organism=Chromera_velia_CCMP2878 / gene_product=hypothetical protein / transcript_product=hypothetical protein / location=Cvel_scaffold137:15553-16173(-) / protein_length=207 / sequence_SO=supercontig / SO=protein_coding / is_pseudo=false
MITTVNTYLLNGLVPDAIWGCMLGGPIPDSLLHSWGQYKGVDVKLYRPLRRMVEEFAKTLETNSLIATSGPVSYRLMKDLVEMATHITGVGQQSQNVLFLGLAHVPPRGHSCSPAPASPRKQGKTGGSGSPGGRSDGDDLRPSKPTDNCPHPVRWKRKNQQFWGVKKEGSKYVCKRCGRSDGVTSAGHSPGPFRHCPYYDMTCDGCG